jgi:hypothetical protein
LPPASGPAVFRGTPRFFDVSGKTTAYDAITAEIAPHPLALIPQEIVPIAQTHVIAEPGGLNVL